MKLFSIKRILLILALPMLVFGIFIYSKYFSSNTNFSESKKYIYVPTNADYNTILDSIKQKDVLSSFSSFEKMANQLNLQENIHPGKYAISKGMGNYALVKMLRSGQQEPVKLVINKLRTKRDIVQKLSKSFEADSFAFMNLFSNPDFLKENGIDSNQLQCLILPNTYELYWNSEPKKIMEKLLKYQKKFWNADRLAKAKKIGYRKEDVVNIASIVEEETLKKEDKLKIASTYLNRLRIGMPLQADPTLKFAVNNFALKRILTVHTQVVSPYNTYKNAGLPPGPICTPSQETIDAVLDAPTTSYLYFCAREDFSGYSNFASTLDEHHMNAKKYQQALNQRGIK